MQNDLLPGEELEEESFLDGEEIEDQSLTPTGLPAMTQTEQSPLRVQLSPAAGAAAGFEVPVPRQLTDIAADVAKGLTDPSVSIPTATGIAATAVGGPGAGIAMSGIAGMMVDLQKQADRYYNPDEPISENEFVIGQTLRGLPFGQQLFAMEQLARAQSVDPAEAAKSVITAGLFESGIDGVSYGAAKILGKIPTLSPKPERVFVELAEDMKKHGVRASLAQATDNSVIDWMDGVARNGPIGKQIMANFDENNLASMESWIKKINKQYVKTFGDVTSDEQIGSLLDKSVNIGRSAYKATADIMYDRVDELAGGTIQKVAKERVIPSDILNPKTGKPFLTKGITEVDEVVGGVRVPTNSVKKKIQEELIKSSEIANVDIRGKVASTLKGALKMNDTISFTGAHRLRSHLLDEIRAANNPGYSRIYGGVMKTIDDSMERAAKELSPEAYSAWRKANRFYRNGKEIFENDFLANLFIEHSKSPERIGKSIYRTGNVDTVKNVKTALRAAAKLDKRVNYEEGLNAMKTGFQDGLLNKHLVVDPEIPGGKTYNFHGILADLEDRDIKSTMDALFESNHREAIRRWATAGTIATKKNRSQAFGLINASALVGAMVRPSAETISLLTVVSALPAAAAKLMTSPKAVNALTSGFSEIGIKGRLGIQAFSDTVLRVAKSFAEDAPKTRARFENLYPEEFEDGSDSE